MISNIRHFFEYSVLPLAEIMKTIGGIRGFNPLKRPSNQRSPQFLRKLEFMKKSAIEAGNACPKALQSPHLVSIFTHDKYICLAFEGVGERQVPRCTRPPREEVTLLGSRP
jgi:hypothetical protein